ncbi:MAG: hypothetical protein HYV95_03735 [Opitutae bacterium]|nr:hypothetical protein [Opitutae bacterium]
MIAFLKRILGVPVSRKDKECADSEWRKALWEQHQRDKFEQEEKRRLNSAATDMLGSWGWDFDKRTLADTISLLLTDRKTKTHLFSQYTEKLHYLAKKRVDGKVTKTLYIAQGAWQLNAAYVGHARAGLENGYEVSCCLVLSDYESVMPLHACPFPSPAEDVR